MEIITIEELDSNGIIADPHDWVEEYSATDKPSWDSFTESMHDLASDYQRLLDVINILVMTGCVSKRDVLAAIKASEELP